MYLDRLRARYPSLPYVAPFALFVVFLAIQRYNPLPEAVEMPVRIVILSAVLWLLSRDLIDLHARSLGLSVCVGVGVFVIWILPDALFPQYRQHWLFQNALTGQLHSSLSSEARMDPFMLTLRSLRAVVLVPIVEELFWRAWLMRWLISPRFQDIRLGTYNPQAFFLTAFLFATEHGPYWEVGLLAGLVYNWWMVRTRNLGDCILAHAVTNACLSGYIIATHRWEYWL